VPEHRTAEGGCATFSVVYATQPNSWDVERRDDGAVLVRVHSRNRQGRPLPDAVFAFRQGDPQYDYWEQMLLDCASVQSSR
jgi:hypothetical protein